MDQLRYFGDDKARGLCDVLAEAYSQAMVRLDQLDEVDPEGIRYGWERQQLRAQLDLCYTLWRGGEARTVFDKAEVVSPMEVAAA